MVAPRLQRYPRRRAQRRRVEVVVAQTFGGELVQRRHRDRTAEAARYSEPHVVDENDDDVGCAGRRRDPEARRRLDLIVRARRACCVGIVRARICRSRAAPGPMSAPLDLVQVNRTSHGPSHSSALPTRMPARSADRGSTAIRCRVVDGEPGSPVAGWRNRLPDRHGSPVSRRTAVSTGTAQKTHRHEQESG